MAKPQPSLFEMKGPKRAEPGQEAMQSGKLWQVHRDASYHAAWRSTDSMKAEVVKVGLDLVRKASCADTNRIRYIDLIFTSAERQ